MRLIFLLSFFLYQSKVIQSSDIILEEQSKNTYQNAQFTRKKNLIQFFLLRQVFI